MYLGSKGEKCVILKLWILFSSLQLRCVSLLNDSSEVADSVARAPILTVVCVFSWCEKAHALSTETFV